MNRKNHASVVRLTSLALLAALVVVLQTVASGIRIGPVPISLTLVPIVVGAILFGPGAGAGLGAVFGVVCLIAGITGADEFTNVLWVASPFWLVVVCVGKAVLCGLCAGLVAKALRHRQTISCILAALTAPVVNTGVFAIGFILLRIVDPENKSKTLNDTALTGPLTTPFEMFAWSMAPGMLLHGQHWQFIGLYLVIFAACIVVNLIFKWWWIKLPLNRPAEGELK